MKRSAIPIAAAFCAFFLAGGSVWGQSRIPQGDANFLLASNARQAGTLDDYVVVFFEVPTSVTSTIYFGVNSPDVYFSSTTADAADSSSANAVYGGGVVAVTTAQTDFYLYGGAGAFSHPESKHVDYLRQGGDPLAGGSQLAYFANTNMTSDEGWTYFPGVSPSQGESIGTKRYFKIVVRASSTGPANNWIKNGFQLDASLSPSGTPTGIAGVRSFAYAWPISLRENTIQYWELYPFVPQGQTGNIVFYNWDMDSSGTLWAYNKTEGALAPLNPTRSADSTSLTDFVGSASQAYAIGGGTNGTWHLRVQEGATGVGDNINGAEFWFSDTADTDLTAVANVFKTYAANNDDPPVATKVVVSPQTATTSTGTDATYSLQVLDASDNPVDYPVSVQITVAGIGTLQINNVDNDETVVTDNSGSKTFTVRGDTIGLQTITITPVGLTGDTATLDIVANPEPTLSSASNTNFNEGASPTLPQVTITEHGASSIFAADTDTVLIRIPSSLKADFTTPNPSATNATFTDFRDYANAGAGTKIARFDPTADLADGQTIVISGLQLTTGAGSNSSGSLELSYDGGATWNIVDDKVITILDPAAPYIWTAGHATLNDWEQGTNWSTGTFPNAATANVIIPYMASGEYPVLTASHPINNLTVGSGASVNLAALNLTVNGSVNLSGATVSATTGTLILAGAAKTITSGGTAIPALSLNAGASYTQGDALTVSGAFTLTAGATLTASGYNLSVGGTANFAGTYTAGTGTVYLTSAGAQSLIPGGNTFATVTMRNGGTTTLNTNNLTATTLNLEGTETLDQNSRQVTVTTLNLGNGSAAAITNTAALTVNGTATINAPGGPVTLANAANSFANDIVLTNGAAVSIYDTTSLGISGTATTSLTLQSTSTVTQPAAGILNTPILRVQAVGGITLNEANTITSTFCAANAAAGNVSLTNTGTLTLGDATLASVSTASGGTVTIANTGGVTVARAVSAGTGTVRIRSGAGAIANGTGTITADTIYLQDGAGAGAIGASGAGNAILTATSNPGTTTTTIYLGGGNATGAYVSHTGALALAAPNLAGNAPLSVVASGLLTLPASAINTGSGALTLTSGTSLATAGTLSSSTSITLTANGGGLSIGHTVTGGTVTLDATAAIAQTAGTISGSTIAAKTRNTPGAAITLDQPTNNFANVSLLSRNAGDAANAAGVITFVDADGFDVAAAGIHGTALVSLTADGAVTDTGTILAGNLALRGAGSYTLDSANTVGKLAAALTGGALDFTNSAAFDVDTVDALPGIVLSNAASALTLTAGANTITLYQGLTTNAGAISITASPVSLGATVTVTNGDTASAVAPIGFPSSIISAVAGSFGLTLTAGSSNVSITGAVGTTALAYLDVTSGAQTTFGGAVTTTGTQSVTSTTIRTNGTHSTANSAIAFTGNLTLLANTVLSAGNSTIGVTGTVNGNRTLTANATGLTTFGSDIGTATALAGLTTDAGGDTSFGGSTIRTQGGGTITFNDQLRLSLDAALDTTNNSGYPAGANIVLASVDANARAFTLNGGTGGVLSSSANIEEATTFTVTNCASAAFSGSVGLVGTPITAVVLAATIGTTNAIAFNGGLFATTFTVNAGAAAYDVTLGATGTVTNPVTFGNAGDLTISSGFAFTNGATKITAGITYLAGAISSTDGPFNFSGAGGVTLSGAASLDTNASTTAGDITLGAVTASIYTLDLATGDNTLGADVSGTSFNGTGTLALADIGGTATFTGAIIAGSLTVANTVTGVSLTGTGTSITNAVTFDNDGSLTLGDAAGDTLAFSGGVTATAPLSKNVAGTISAAGIGVIDLGGNATSVTATTILGGAGTGLITLGDANLAAGATLTLGAASAARVVAGAITTTAVGNLAFNSTSPLASTITSFIPTSASALTITRVGTGGLSFTGDVGASGTPLSSLTFAATIGTTGTVSFSGAAYATAATANAGAGNYNIAFNGGGTITNAVTFNNGGSLAVGDAAADTFTFTNGATKSNAGGKILGGTIETANAALNFGGAGAITLADDTILDTNATVAAASLTVSAVTGATYDLTLASGTGANVSGTSISGVGTLDLQNIGGTASFTGAVSATTLTVAASVVNVALTGTGGTIANLVEFLNTGTLSLGQSLGTMTFDGGVETAGNGSNPTTVTVRGTIAASDDPITFGAITLGADTILDANATTTAGDITLGAVTAATYALTIETGNGVAGANVAATTFTGTGTLALQNIGGAANFTGAVSPATLTVATSVNDLTLGGATGTITNTVTFQNGGILSLGQAGGTLTFNGGLSTAAVVGTVTTYGSIVTSNDAITLGDIALGADTVLYTAASSAAGSVSIGDVTGGTYTLVIRTGAAFGNFTSSGVITAQYLRIITGGAIGTAVTPIDIDVDYFEASAGGLVNVSNNGALAVGFAGAIGAYGPDITGIAAGGGGALTLESDDLAITESITGTGALTLRPRLGGTVVVIGNTGGAFSLDDTELGLLADGFSGITLGRSDSSNAVISTASFKDPITILSGGSISSTVVSPALATTQDNAGITVTSVGLINMTADITAHGSGAVDVNSGAGFTLANGIAVSSTSGAIMIDTTGANDMTVNGTITTGLAAGITLTASRSIIMDADSAIATSTGAIVLDADAAAAGSLVLDVVQSASAQVTLRAGTGGTITEADNSALISTTGLLYLNDAAAGLSVGGVAPASLNTSVGTIKAQVSGNLYINETNAVSLGDGTGGIASSAGLIDIAAGGTIAIANNVSAATGISIATSAGSIERSAGTLSSAAGSLALAATGGHIGVDAGNDGVVDGTWIATNVTALRGSATAGGIFITEANAVQLGDGTSGLSATNGNVNVQTTAGAVTTGNAITTTAAGNIALTAGGSTITVSNNLGAAGTATFNSPVAHTAATITAGPAAIGSTAILFTGSYTGTGGTLAGNAASMATGPDIEFQGNTVLGSFAHNGDRIVFSGPLTPQTFDSNGQPLGDVRVAKALATDIVRLATNDATQVGDDLTLAVGILDLDTNNRAWLQDSAAGAVPADAFTGRTGVLTLAAGTELRCGGFTSAGGHTVTNAGANTIRASGSAAIAGTFNAPLNSTLVMTGAGTLTAPTEIGNLDIGTGVTGTAQPITASVTLGADLTLAGNLAVNDEGSLDVSAVPYAIAIAGDWTNRVEAAGGSSRFVARTGTVTFTKSSGTIAIGGSTTWYGFVCEEPGVTIAFSNNPDLHTFLNLFRVHSPLLPSPSITLTKLAANGAPNNPPVFPADSTLFWDILVDPAATIEMQNVDVYYSNASANPIIAQLQVDVSPYTTYFNYKWLSGLLLMYSFTEDSDQNGKIDRIRVQAAAAVGNDFSGFRVEVDGYTVKGYSRPIAGPNFYILLEEKPRPDTDARPQWTILTNTTLTDQLPGTQLASTYDFPMIPTDTAPPRIMYTLALPGLDRVLLRASEPLQDAGPSISFSMNLGTVDAATPVANSGGETEYLLDTSAVLDVATLASGSRTVTISNADDGAAPAPDYSLVDVAYPPPTYPTAYGNYSTYDTLPAATPAGVGLSPPNPLANPTHRATDLLISVPPASATDANYFVWPIWAKDSVVTGLSAQEYEGLTQAEAASQTIGLVRDFTGAGWLRDQDITLQARVNSAIGTPTALRLYYDTNVPESSLSTSANGPVGLWLPTFSETAFSGLVPAPRNGTTGISSSAPVAPLLWNLAIDSDDPKVKSVSTLDFFFTFGAENATDPLYAARLDVATGAAVPADWYRRIKPFTFDIHDVKKQRSNVTILNNVIDPTKGELVRLSYQLTKGGSLTIQVFTLDGDLVDVLYRGNRAAGDYVATWDGKNRGGRAVARGMYFIRVVGPEIDEIRKVLVVK